MVGMSPMVALGTAQREAVSASIEAAVRWGTGSGNSALRAAESGGDGGVGDTAATAGSGGGSALAASGIAEALTVAAAVVAEGVPRHIRVQPLGTEAGAETLALQTEAGSVAAAEAEAEVEAEGEPALTAAMQPSGTDANAGAPQTEAGAGEGDGEGQGAGAGAGAGATAAMVAPHTNAVVATTEAAGADLHISGPGTDLDLCTRRVRVNALVASTLEKYGGVTSVLPSMQDMLATFACAMARLGAPPGPTLLALRRTRRSFSQVR